MKKFFLPFLILFSTISFSQKPTVEVLTSGTKTSLRGLSVVNDNVIWVSGSNGTIGKSTNGGKTWKWMIVKGFEKTEFRDIEAFDANTAVIMGVDAPAYILRTVDGGETWQIVYENKTPGMFLDAMDFATPGYGMVIGDPVNGKIFLAETYDGGKTWAALTNINIARPDSGEAFFAASGTNIRLFANKQFRFVSGGKSSRFFTNNSVSVLPLMQGKESTGANSIDIYYAGIPAKPRKRMIVVGGDFAADSLQQGNCVYSNNGGRKWKKPRIPPHGYRSSVEYLSQTDILACGINGVDYSRNGGKTWKWVSTEGFNVCRIARIGSFIFLAGNNGKIARISWK